MKIVKSFLTKFSFLLIFVYSLFTIACSGGMYPLLFGEDTVDDRTEKHLVLTGSQTPQSAIDKNTDTNGIFSFVVITDPHFGADQKRHDDKFLAWFEAQLVQSDETLKPRFAVCLGDSANDGYEDQYKTYSSFTDKVCQLGNDKLGISDFKFYTSIGNHDLFHNGYEHWKKLIYPYSTYFSFKINEGTDREVTFYSLDSANGTLGANQLEDWEDRLDGDTSPKIVMTHYPVYANGHIVLTTQDDMFIARILTASAKNNVKYIFEGHTHRASDKNYTLFKEMVSGSFLYDRTATLVTVNPSTGEVTAQRIYF